MPERAVVAAMADYCSRYRPGIQADKPVALPRVLQDESGLIDGQISDFLDESRAYMLADICAEVFDLEAEVVDDGNGWTVVIRAEDADSIDAEQLCAMQGVCRLLQYFTVIPAPIDDRCEAPAERQARREDRSVWRAEMNRTIDDLRDRLTRIEAAVTGGTHDALAGI